MPRLALALLAAGCCSGMVAAADLDVTRGPPAPPPAASPQKAFESPAQADGGKDQPSVETPRDELTLPQPGAPAQGESWWQKIVREAPECRVFSDGCRTCDRDFRCSGLPIACQPKDFSCLDPKP